MTFVTLAVVACSTVFGLLWEHILLRLVFSAVHMLFLVAILIYLYYVGYLEGKNPKNLTTT